ncbi:MAG TPA: DNA repair protein RecN [Chloroflexota bacterium]|jgi:DNA repair protein RecN (Recombination protein N)
MLIELNVQNFAVIERLRLELGPGFNVLTGETGAGKSILIDAVSGLLGARLGSESIRAGEQSARVEGVFQVEDDPELRTRLDELGVESDDGTLIVSRDIAAAGRSIARVNGRAVPASALAQLAPHLVDIHGQNENLSLLRVSAQLLLLDAYAGLDAERAALAERVAELRRVRREREALGRDERELARQVDLLQFQIEEIGGASVQPGEDDELEAERRVLANAERLIELAETAYGALYEGADELRPATELLDQAAHALDELARLDPEQDPAAQRARELSVQAADLAHDLRAYRDRVEVDPQRLSEVEERLELLRTLKRKYGPTIADVIAFGQQAADELDELSRRQSRADELEARERELVAELAGQAAALSAGRRAGAERLSSSVESQLAYLNMPNARFAVEVARQPAGDGLPVEGELVHVDATGIDRVEFLVAPNPGEPLRPLAKIASGGETARLMLALKASLAAVDQVPVLIFDEVDQGVGGRSGRVIGEKLAELSHSHQVICVTHLPQIASFADAHYRIVKTVEGDRTRTTVSRLDEAGRVEELAAMLGGTRHGLDQARALIEEARGARARGAAGTAG